MSRRFRSENFKPATGMKMQINPKVRISTRGQMRPIAEHDLVGRAVDKTLTVTEIGFSENPGPVLRFQAQNLPPGTVTQIAGKYVMSLSGQLPTEADLESGVAFWSWALAHLTE